MFEGRERLNGVEIVEVGGGRALAVDGAGCSCGFPGCVMGECECSVCFCEQFVVG